MKESLKKKQSLNDFFFQKIRIRENHRHRVFGTDSLGNLGFFFGGVQGGVIEGISEWILGLVVKGNFV